jgi:hypothetical protein
MEFFASQINNVGDLIVDIGNVLLLSKGYHFQVLELLQALRKQIFDFENNLDDPSDVALRKIDDIAKDTFQQICELTVEHIRIKPRTLNNILIFLHDVKVKHSVLQPIMDKHSALAITLIRTRLSKVRSAEDAAPDFKGEVDMPYEQLTLTDSRHNGKEILSLSDESSHDDSYHGPDYGFYDLSTHSVTGRNVNYSHIEVKGLQSHHSAGSL